MTKRLLFLACSIIVVGLDLPRPFAGRVAADTPPLGDPLITLFSDQPPASDFFAPPGGVPGGPTSTLLAGSGGHVISIDPVTGLIIFEFDPLGPGFAGPVNFTPFSFNGGPSPDTLFVGPHLPSTAQFAGWALTNPPQLLGRTDDEWARLGGLRVASGNFIGDITPEIVFGSGPGGPGSISITELGRDRQYAFGAFGGNHPHGTSFAAGDMDADGFAELGVCSEGPESMFELYAFRGMEIVNVVRGGTMRFQTAGRYCRLELFDLDLDGGGEIILGSMSSSPSEPPRVKVYKREGNEARLAADVVLPAGDFPNGAFPAGLLINGEPHLAVAGGDNVRIFEMKPRFRFSRTIRVPGVSELFNLESHTPPTAMTPRKRR